MSKQARKGLAQGKVTYRCPKCPDLPLPSWAACERHRDETAHIRFEVLKP